MIPSFPFRGKRQNMVTAVIAVLMLAVLTVSNVSARGHLPTVAADGQTLAGQSPEVQALFFGTYGDDAPTQWAAEHNAAIGAMAESEPMPMDGQSDDCDYVAHTAYLRSGDMDLAAVIAANVKARGSCQEFLAGNDPGISYGVVLPPTIVLPNTNNYNVQAGRFQVQLRVNDGLGTLAQSVSGLPDGWSFVEDQMVIRGYSTEVGASTTVTYTVTDQRGDSDSAMFTITVVSASASVSDCPAQYRWSPTNEKCVKD